MRRREVIAGLSASLAASLPVAKSFAQADQSALSTSEGAGACVLTITGDDGPFYFDPKLLRVNITEGKPGASLQLAIRVVEAGNCKEIVGARTDVWQADAMGLYSGYDKQTGVGAARTQSTLGQTFLRGTQLTGKDGAATFRTIYPSWYRGRTPHIHFKVFLGKQHVVTNQIIFPEDINDEVFRSKPYNRHAHVRDTFNANDSYLKRDGSGVLCRIEKRDNGYRASLLVSVRRA